MKIGLFGNFGSGNLGNDGSLEAMTNFLRRARPDAELVCICEGPDEIRRDLDIPAISSRYVADRASFLSRIPLSRTILGMVHALRVCGRLDILISPGTGLLDDFSDTPWGMPAVVAIWCASARLRRRKTAFVSIGAGPIVHPVSRWLFKAAARIVHYRSYRDAKSKEFLRSIGLKVDRDPIYPDLAFGLPPPAAPTARPGPQKPATIGVGVMRYHGWRSNKQQGAEIYQAYLGKLVQFVTILLDKGLHVKLLVGDKSDKAAVKDVLAGLDLARPDYPRTAVLVPERTNSLHDVMLQMSDTDFVVATRFHNIICALKMKKPCISVGYAQKFDVLMAEMGLGQFCQHIERLDVDLLTAQLEELMSNEAIYRQALDKVNKEYQQRLSLQEDTLSRSILA